MSLLITRGLGAATASGGILPMELAATKESVQMALAAENELQLEVAGGDHRLTITADTGYSMEMSLSVGTMTMTTHCEVD